MAEWRKQKILTPAKRGRKPGSGKKNIIKAATGKVVFVSVDLSRYANGTILLQVLLCVMSSNTDTMLHVHVHTVVCTELGSLSTPVCVCFH